MKGGSRLLWFLFSLCCYCVIINNNGVEGSHKIHHEYQCVPDTKVRQVHRTGYHFQPPRNWINGTLFSNFFKPQNHKPFFFISMLIDSSLFVNFLLSFAYPSHIMHCCPCIPLRFYSLIRKIGNRIRVCLVVEFNLSPQQERMESPVPVFSG